MKTASRALASALGFLLLGGLSSKVAAQATVVTSFPTPNGLGLCAVNPALDKIYFALGTPTAQQMIALDGTTFSQTALGNGDDVAVDLQNNNYWSAGVYSDSLTVWNSANNQLTSPGTGCGCPIAVSMDTPHRRLWTSAQCCDGIYVFDADTFALVNGPISVGGVGGNIFVNPATGRAYFENSSGSQRVNPSTFAVTANLFGEVAAANSSANLLYAFANNGITLQIINGTPDPEEIITSAPLPFNVGTPSCDINPGLNHLYVGNNAGNNIAILDATTGQTLGFVILGPSVNSVGKIVVDSARNRVYVTATSGGVNTLFVVQDGGSANPVYTLTAATPGGGSVVVSPPSGPYTNGTVVTLTATPSNNWSFLGWTGSVTTNASLFTLIMNSNQTETAIFGTALNIQSSPGGSVTASPVQSLYPYGTNVVLTATPQSGYYFQSWQDDASAGGGFSPYDFVVTVGNPTIAATFSTSQAGHLSLICRNDPALVNPGFLTSDGVNLYVTGVGVGNNQQVFQVPIGGGPASILYGALNPAEIALIGSSLFWIDPNAGPVTDTEILKAPDTGNGSVTPIYIGSQVGQPIVDGRGLASDGVALYAADEVDGTVWRLNQDGTGLVELGLPRYSGYFSTEHFNSVAVSQGVVYVADSGSSGVISPQVISIPIGGGGFSTLALGPPFVQPLGIAVGNGMIYVSDQGANNTIWQMPITGGVPTPLVSGLPFRQIEGITYVNGTLYVCDNAGGAIYSVNLTTNSGFTLTASTAGGGSVKVSPPGPYTNNQVVTLTAMPSNNWSFVGWTGSTATNASTFTLTMSSNQTEQAVFGTTLNVQQLSGGTVQYAPMQSLYPFGSTVTLTAIPQSSNFFQGWLDAASPGGSSSPYSFVVTSAAPTIDASFVPNPTTSVITSLPAPPGLNLCAVNPALNKIYFASGNPAAEQMVVVDGATFQATGIGTGDAVDVDTANNNYWSVGVYSGTATVWNGNDSAFESIPLNYCPINVSVDTPHRTVWVGAQCGPGNDPLWAINADTHVIMAGPISSGGVQGSILVNPATGRLYINPSGVSRRINPAPSYAVTANAFGQVIGVNPAENLLYAQSSSTTLQIINGAPDPEVVLTSVTLPFPLGGTLLGVNPTLNRIYVGNSGGNNIAILNATTGQMVGSIFLGAGVTGIGTIIVDSTRNRIYALAISAGANQLYVLQDQVSVNPTFTVAATTAGGGSVAVSPPSGSYTNSSVVTLTATPSTNWSFIGWTGSVMTNAASFHLTVTSNLSEQAVFGTSLNVEPGTNGLVQASPSQSLYAFGSTVILTAAPSNGFHFQSWLAAASAGGSNTPLSFLVTNGAPAVGALFAALPTTNFTLTVGVGGTAGGTATPSPQATVYTNGATVAITATPASGQFFNNWTGDGNGSTANPLIVVMNTNKTVTANFVKPLPPAVTLTNPAAGAAFAWPSNISISASASSPFGSVTNVTFFADNSPIGVASQAPFAVVWTNASVGAHMVTALATASTGLSALSAPMLVTLTNTSGVFAFANPNYAVHESNGVAILTVVSTAPGPGFVLFETTTNGTAVAGGPGGNNSGGDFLYTQNFVQFTGPGSQAIRIPVTDNFNNGSPLQFQVALLNPNGGGLGNPATATVTIMRDDIGNGSLAQQLPTNQPPMTGQLTVYLPPTQAGGQWQFPWEVVWRNSGDTASNLVAGAYPLVFRNEPGYLAIPLTNAPQVTNGFTTVITNTYLPTPLGTLGSLTVTTQPAGGTATGWQFIGETTWRPSGFTVANLVPGTYQVAFQPVSGYATPSGLAVLVTNFGVQLTGGAYTVANPLSGVLLPAPVANSQVTNYSTPDPYAFCGQLQTDLGFGSGVAVTANVVLTAAHLVFDDYTLAFVNNAYWSFQEQVGVFQPEHQAARGIYVLSGYAAQRTNDLASGDYGPGQSSAASRDLDVAALYFTTAMARNGFSGYLSANNAPNPFLASASLPKVLVGYPVDASQFGASVTPGLMYATPIGTNAFSQANDQVYRSSSFFSYPGNSGGPIMVEASSDQYYPAAIYLGTLFDNSGAPVSSVVRAIDSNVTNLISMAALEGDSGTNFSGGGVIPLFTIAAPGVSALHPAFLNLQLGPPAAVQAGAAWKLTNQSAGYYSTAANAVQEITNTNALILQFQTIPGWNPPTNRTVTLTPGIEVTVPANYIVTNPVLTFGSGNTLGLTGTLNTTYQIQSNSTLNSGTWVPFKTNLLSSGFNLITNHARPGFYRAVWLGY